MGSKCFDLQITKEKKITFKLQCPCVFDQVTNFNIKGNKVYVNEYTSILDLAMINA